MIHIKPVVEPVIAAQPRVKCVEYLFLSFGFDVTIPRASAVAEARSACNCVASEVLFRSLTIS
jgi:hypothetical protein